MVIQIDTREHAKERERIERHFTAAGVKFFRSKMYVGDYMELDNPRLCVDRKKDLLEVVGNVTQEHERFRAELIRAQEVGIKIIFLIEDPSVSCLDDVYYWHNPRLDEMTVKRIDGYLQQVQKYPRATRGTSLYKCLRQIEAKYQVTFEFCKPSETGYKIIELLGGKDERKSN